jgi:hypothetical protein
MDAGEDAGDDPEQNEEEEVDAREARAHLDRDRHRRGELRRVHRHRAGHDAERQIAPFRFDEQRAAARDLVRPVLFDLADGEHVRTPFRRERVHRPRTRPERHLAVARLADRESRRLVRRHARKVDRALEVHRREHVQFRGNPRQRERQRRGVEGRACRRRDAELHGVHAGVRGSFRIERQREQLLRAVGLERGGSDRAAVELLRAARDLAHRDRRVRSFELDGQRDPVVVGDVARHGRRPADDRLLVGSRLLRRGLRLRGNGLLLRRLLCRLLLHRLLLRKRRRRGDETHGEREFAHDDFLSRIKRVYTAVFPYLWNA